MIPLDATLVKGSHGRSEVPAGEQALILGARRTIHKAEQVFEEMLAHFLTEKPNQG